MKENNIPVDLQCPVSYLLKNDREQEIAKGKAQAHIEKEKLSLLTETGEALVFPFRDLLEIDDKDYHLFLGFTFDEQLELFNLGFKFDDFVRVLTKNYQEIILQDMLVREKLRIKDIEANFTRFNPEGEQSSAGKCEVRVFETSLAILPARSRIIRIPLGRIQDVLPGNYSLTVTTDSGEKLLLSHLGNRLDEVQKVLTDALQQLSLRTRSFLRELLPGEDTLTIRKLTSLLKEGKIAGRKEIEAISTPVWQELERKISGSTLADEYEFLESIGIKEKVAVGFKRGLLGGEKQDYFWYLIPLSGSKPGEPGNAVAFEAGTIHLPGEPGENPEESLLEQEGKATYFFRLMPGEAYAALKDNAQWEHLLDELIIYINRCLQEVNFRREPIYLAEDKLSDPRYTKYKYAIHRLPELRRLRDLFIGRVIHRSPEQWQKDVEALVKVNRLSPGRQGEGERGE